jgi:hypothetical protein
MRTPLRRALACGMKQMPCQLRRRAESPLIRRKSGGTNFA